MCACARTDILARFGRGFFPGTPGGRSSFSAAGRWRALCQQDRQSAPADAAAARAAGKHSKRLNLRDRVREIAFTPTGSDFESQLLLYSLLRANFPKTYAARLRLRPAPLVKLHLENEYPRASVTTRLGKQDGQNLYYGPFPSRVAAEKFCSDALDFFKMRRCVDDLHPDPTFPGCVYSEMKMCLAPCFKGCTDAEYHAEVARVQVFFDTAGGSLTGELAEQRERASAETAFEEAAAIHARIEKLKPVLAQLSGDCAQDRSPRRRHHSAQRRAGLSLFFSIPERANTRPGAFQNRAPS